MSKYDFIPERRDPEVMQSIINEILKEHGLSAMPDNPSKRTDILSEAKQRYTKVKR